MKKEPRWVKVFLAGLGRSGNVRLAAEGAGVDFSTAYQRRKRHGDFAEAWESALRLRASRSAQDEQESEDSPLSLPSLRDGCPSPPKGGEDWVTRPDGKVIRGSAARWGKRAGEAFLLELTVSANVRRAAAAAGFSTTAVYQRRRKDRRFAAAWDAAIETGKARVQAFLIEAAGRTFDPDELPIADERELPKVSISEAINIAKLGPSTASGRAGKGATNGKGFDDDDEEAGEEHIEEVRERILHKLEGLKKRNDREMIEAGWTEHEIPPRPSSGDGEWDKVWLPPGYRLVREGEG